MNPYYELPNLGNSFSRQETGGPERGDKALDPLISVGALRAVNGVESVIRRVLAAFSRWRVRRASVRALNELHDRDLADIGLDRSQIVSTVDEIIETGRQPASRRSRSWHKDPSATDPAPANDNEDRPLFGGETAARVAQLQR